MEDSLTPQFIPVDDVNIAVRYRQGTQAPGLVWLGGYRSDMSGTKALAVDALAGRLGLSALRHDYSGHGLSQGDFLQGSVSLWLKQSLAVYQHFANGPQIVVGSSLGGWIALRMAEELQKQGVRLAGLVLIAPAPDFTSLYAEPALTERQRQALQTQGLLEIATGYGPQLFSKTLIDDGPANFVLRGMIKPGCPVHILHGMQDDTVPYSHAMRLMEHLPQADVTLTLVKDGDHRLSRPQDIQLLERIIEGMIAAG